MQERLPPHLYFRKKLLKNLRAFIDAKNAASQETALTNITYMISHDPLLNRKFTQAERESLSTLYNRVKNALGERRDDKGALKILFQNILNDVGGDPAPLKLLASPQTPPTSPSGTAERPFTRAAAPEDSPLLSPKTKPQGELLPYHTILILHQISQYIAYANKLTNGLQYAKVCRELLNSIEASATLAHSALSSNSLASADNPAYSDSPDDYADKLIIEKLLQTRPYQKTILEPLYRDITDIIRDNSTKHDLIANRFRETLAELGFNITERWTLIYNNQGQSLGAVLLEMLCMFISFPDIPDFPDFRGKMRTSIEDRASCNPTSIVRNFDNVRTNPFTDLREKVKNALDHAHSDEDLVRSFTALLEREWGAIYFPPKRTLSLSRGKKNNDSAPSNQEAPLKSTLGNMAEALGTQDEQPSGPPLPKFEYPF